MAKHPARLEGGRYDGDQHDDIGVGFWPPLIWAWNCIEHPKGKCDTEVHWSIVPGELVDLMIRQAHEIGVYPELYEKDRLERDEATGKILMVYIYSKMAGGPDGESEEDLSGLDRIKRTAGSMGLVLQS